MGSSASKPETKVFTPTTPVDFSSTFLSQLEQSPEVCFYEKGDSAPPTKTVENAFLAFREIYTNLYSFLSLTIHEPNTPRNTSKTE